MEFATLEMQWQIISEPLNGGMLTDFDYAFYI